MHFALMKITFATEEGPIPGNKKELGNICKKLTSRFDCLATPYSSDQDGSSSIIIAMLARRQNDLNQHLDSVIDFCESSGIGRIVKEDSILEHVDAFLDGAR